MYTIQERLEKGYNVITGNNEKWQECVELGSEGLYNGMEIDNALDIMQAMKDGKYTDVKGIFEKENHSGASATCVIKIVKSFRPTDFDKVEKYLW